MTFTQLRALVAVIDCGGFTRAAIQTGSTQPAISHAIAGLERELGTKLLVRDQGHVHATEVGVRVAALARQVLAAMEEIRQQPSRDDEAIDAAVQVAATPNVARHVLPAALQLLATRHPGIDVTVLEGATDEIPTWLDQHLADVAFMSATPQLQAIEHERLGDDEHVALVPASHPYAAHNVITLQQLAAEQFVMLSDGCEGYIADLFVRAGTEIRPTYRIRETATLAKIVGQGLAVSIISGLSTCDLDDAVSVRPLEPPARRDFAAYWPRRRKTAAARAVVTAVSTIVANASSGMPHLRSGPRSQLLRGAASSTSRR